MKKLILFLFGLSTVAMQGQIIPASRVAGWSNVGYEGTIPDSASVLDVTGFGGIGDSVTDNYLFIVNAINSLNGNRGVIYFPPGNFLIQSTLNLPDSIILQGASSDSTHLIFDLAGAVGNCINITSAANFPFTGVVSGLSKGSSYIVIIDTTGFSPGDYAEIKEDNGSWDTQPVFWADNSVGQIIKVNAVSGDTLFFNQPLRIAYDSALNVQVRKFIPAKEIGIECLDISRRDSVATGFCVNMYFDHAVNCWVRGVESSRSVGSHIEAVAASHLEITGNYIHHSFAYDGTSTHGYGITLNNHSCECKLENNIMRHLRHSFSMQCGANGNVIAYNYSIDPNRSEFPSNFGADISMHGHYAFANLFEGNIVQNIQIDSIWGPTGPFNTFFRNRAELYGILMSAGVVSSDSQNFVGNEITNNGAFMGNYILAGNGHFEYGNNQTGTIIPPGTTTLNDSSCYLSSAPDFWNPGSSFPSIGEPNVSGSGSIPARDRYLSGVNFTVCNESIITGIKEDLFSRDEITVYPNPAHDLLNVLIPLHEEKNIRVIITDISGRKHVDKIFYSEKKEDFLRISIPENLKAGIYFLSVQTEKKVMIKKIVLD